MKIQNPKLILYIVFVLTIFATLGSLFFSNILHFPPCVLCWYQRIFMYPLVIILAVGIWRRDEKIYLYVLPLSAIGGIIAFYHNLLYYKLIPNSLVPCEAGISCTTKFIEWFGFITIPLLSFCVFLIITILMLFYKKFSRKV